MNIIIVGGGTAGWITAFLLSKKCRNHKITVIESSSIPIIGVGEGVTGKLTDMFEDPFLGLDEFEFIQETWSLPKYGIKFTNWTGNGSSFYSPIEGSATESLNFDVFLYNAIHKNIDIGLASFSGHFYKDNKLPWQVLDGKLKWTGGKAYHMDAYKVGEFFKKRAVGVNCIDAKIVDVSVTNDEITSVVLDNNTIVDGDFFIDCSGFSKVLMSKLEGYNWIDESEKLPVNKALIFKPKKEKNPKYPYTHAIANDAGWTFEIPTRNKVGRGYIHSDQFITKDALSQEIEKNYGEFEEIKTISFSAGRCSSAWISNCLSLGLSSNFLEPLQATSLHVSITQIEKFIIDCLMPTKAETINSTVMKKYNEFFNILSNELVDFVQATYMGGRIDTDFWKHMTYDSKKSDRLINILNLAKHRLIRSSDFNSYNGYAGQAIWNYTLAGLGYFKSDIIEKVLANNNINLGEVDVGWQEFHQTMKSNLNIALTVDQLNDILLQGQDLKLSKINI